MATKWREGWAVRDKRGRLLRRFSAPLADVWERKWNAQHFAKLYRGEAVRVRYCDPVVIETKKARGKK